MTATEVKAPAETVGVQRALATSFGCVPQLPDDFARLLGQLR